MHFVKKTTHQQIEISQAYVLHDSFRMQDSVLAFLNENFASKENGLVYEFPSWHTNRSTTASGNQVSIEVRRSCSMAVDACLISRSATNTTLITKDSFASVPAAENDHYQWRYGSNFFPNTPVDSIVQSYQQMLYWCDKMRHEKSTSVTLEKFTGKSVDGNNDDLAVTYGRAVYPVVLQRNNILDQSGVMINNTMTLAIEATLNGDVQGVSGRQNTIFTRHIRRVVLFLENCLLFE